MVKMLHFLFIIGELSCETSHSASNSTDKERAMHYGSEIDDYGAKISHYHYFSAGGCEGPVLCFLPKVVPFDEIAVYRSDPRHVTKLMSRSGGLGVVITAGTHGCDVF